MAVDGTVVYVQGKEIGVNVSGDKEGGDGPNKDKLKVELTARKDQGVAVTDGIGNSAKTVAWSDIKNGDQVQLRGVTEMDDDTFDGKAHTVVVTKKAKAAEPKDKGSKAKTKGTHAAHTAHK